MKSYQAVACAILVCLAIGGASGFGDDYGTIKKIIVYGKDKVILPTLKNMMIVCSDLLQKSLKYAPQAIKYDLEDLVKRINYFNGDIKKIIALAENILYKIQKGYIADCDYANQLEESMYVVILLFKYCNDDYTYYNYKN